MSRARLQQDTEITDFIPLLIFFLPGLTPIFVSIARFYAANTRYNLPLRVGLVIISLGISIAMTCKAYHIRTSYEALPQTDDFLWVGLVWALVATMPAIVAIVLNNKELRGAALSGGVISFLALIILSPMNIGLALMFSFE
ncbi:MAG: hypothetical protein ACR2QU_00890 [Gammaproteobacteria bacterium]